MTRSAEEARRDAVKFAEAFENHEPDPSRISDAATLRAIAAAREGVTDGQKHLARTVRAARKDGQTWAAIGAMLEMSGEAARQRYGTHGKGRTRLHLRTREKAS